MAKNNPIPKYNGIGSALSQIYRNEGMLALYRGVVVNAVSGSIANGIFYYV
jgi:hypothetical protein